MRTTAPFTTHISLLIGIEALTIVSFVLSILTLTYGGSTNSVGQSAILTFNTSSIRNAVSNVASTSTGVADWYEVNYLSNCSGMWQQDAVSSSNKNQTTISCAHRKIGYTFSLAQSLPSNAAQLLPTDSTYGTISTKNTQVLLIIAIIFLGISMTSLLYGMIVLHVASTPPLFVLRVGYLASIPAVILLTVSSAKITAAADKMVGVKDLGAGVTVNAWMGWRFYVSTWLATGFMWAVVGFSIVGAFKVASAMEVQKRKDLAESGRARLDEQQ